jgi:starch synthase (maltosyl-transferring)
MADTGMSGQQQKRRGVGMTQGASPLRVQAVRLAHLAAEARRAAGLGFTHVLAPPPFRAGRDGPFLVRDFGALCPAIGGDLAKLAREVAAAGVGLLIDVVVDRVDSGFVSAGADPFVAPDPGLALDPRHPVLPGAALARLEGPDDVADLAAWWAAKLVVWHAAGVAGFRLLGLRAVPEGQLASFFAALREAVPEAVLLPWTPGLSRGAVRSLRGQGTDGVFASLPWWDGRADWLWTEVDDLLSVAPVLGMDAVPPGPDHGARGGRLPAGLAAAMGQGWLHVPGAGDDDAELRRLNGALAAEPAFAAGFAPVLPAGEGGRVVCLLRTDEAAARSARRAALAVVNLDPNLHLQLTGETVLTSLGGGFAPFQEVGGQEAGGATLCPDTRIGLAPGQTRLFTAGARAVAAASASRAAPDAAREAAGTSRLAIERPSPCVDAGRFPVKAVAGEVVAVEADVVFDGHEKIAVALRWRGPGGRGPEGHGATAVAWQEVPMRPLGNDRWTAELPLNELGRHEYVVTAWRDRWETFRDELAKKAAAGLKLTLELAEGEALVRAAVARAGAPASLRRALSGGGDDAARVRALLEPALAADMAAADDRPFAVETAPIPVDAERALVRFASWYEVFPRSLSDDPDRHGTFADVERHLPRIRDMGFDVLYFPPISPIGRVNRKGRNNTLTPTATDPGSPYAVGSEEGGHDALHPELGTLEDFQHLQQAAAAHGLEIAIDFAIQCSPDHPWLKQHKGWFDWRPDGSIKYAENPPKKYEDIVNVDFYAKDAIPGLWVALCDVVLFWAEQGIRIFRVDNPHTKPFPFWEWMIREVRTRYPDAMFLAEAFTRPKVMYRLAKIGFSQSYTYFTWRNEKAELEDYLTELNTDPVRHFFRPHFFVNTPDINPLFLQRSGRPGFLIRAALAATLSGLFGVYNGFELCEAAAVPGKEEYLDSEKYQLRAWDWDRPGNITAEITALNRIRRRNPALQTHLGVRFLTVYNDQVLYFEKSTPDRSNVVLVAVSLDPHAVQEADIELPLWLWRLTDEAALDMQDLIGGGHGLWHGKYHRIRLTPEQPYAIWRASVPL